VSGCAGTRVAAELWPFMCLAVAAGMNGSERLQSFLHETVLYMTFGSTWNKLFSIMSPPTQTQVPGCCMIQKHKQGRCISNKITFAHKPNMYMILTALSGLLCVWSPVSKGQQ
jgi:hypothetical protein